MKRYILERFIRSIFSIFAVVAIAIVLIFSLIPKNKVFDNDPYWKKIAADPIGSITYQYTKWEDLGYVDFLTQGDLCSESGADSGVCSAVRTTAFNTVKEEFEANGYKVNFSEDGTAYAKKGFDEKYDQTEMCKMSQSGVDIEECSTKLSSSFEEITKEWEAKGYQVKYYLDGNAYAFKDEPVTSIIWKFFSNFIQMDHPWKVEDESNPDLERKVYIEKDFNGIPAVKCAGCEHQYLFYFNSSFPFIHQNWITLDFGKSFPTYSGVDVMDVIGNGQGEAVMQDSTFDNGQTINSALNLHSCKYKPTSTLDTMEKDRFNTNYAKCESYMSAPSMIGTSYILGVLGVILSYLIAIPAGIVMARNKDKWQDKLGIIYINFMISVPSLAFIFFMRLLGRGVGLPDKFPHYGFGDVRSYVLPVVILALLSTAGLMIWTRRYMVDQANSDYVKFARAKGLSQKEIFRNHILRNAIIPIVNGIPGSIILCISGAVITESAFAVPGMGKMLPDAITASNNNTIVALTFIFTTLSVLSLLAGDILMTFVDPRIQLSSKGETR